MSTETFTPDNLFAGDFPVKTSHVTLLANEGALARGAVLGKASKGAASIAADVGNTGDGAAGAVTIGVKAKVGAYNIECVEAASNAGRFKVIDPDGERLDDLTVAVAYSNEHFGITIADGDADFVVGDKFTLTVAAGSGKHRLVNSANTDGSGNPLVVLAEDTTVGVSDVENVPVYETGEFNEDKLTFGGTDTKETHRAALKDTGIYLRSVSDQ